jgi:2-iminoacetate synthase ThiH
MQRLCLLFLLLVAAAQVYLVQDLRSALLTPQTHPIEAMLETPITATKNGIQITTTVTTYQHEEESDEAHAIRHLAKVDAYIAALTAAGWTVV